MRYFFLFNVLLFVFAQACTQANDSNKATPLYLSSGDNLNNIELKKGEKNKVIVLKPGKYELDRMQLPFANYVLDSGAVIVSNTYAPYLPGKVKQQKQTSFAYRCYNPTVTVRTIIGAKRNFFQYNHDASITYFNGFFFAFWNGLARGGKDRSEGTRGQQNFMSKSSDAIHWSAPVALFNDPDYTNNPLPEDPLQHQQWQPNVIALADRMLVIWSETGPFNASYISVFIKGQQKITTYRIDINIDNKSIKLNSDLSTPPAKGYSTNYVINGGEYFIYSTQNPYQLSTGRLLIPFSVEESSGDFNDRIKWASFIYTDDPSNLNSYAFGPLTRGITASSAWEPFFTEDRKGIVYMHMRNLPSSKDTSKDIDKNMSIAVSKDGLHFSEPVLSSLIGPSSRAYSERISNNRFMMVYNDADKRINGVANFSRYGGYDFTPGVSLQKDLDEPGDAAFNYPQSIIYRDTAYVIYSTSYEPRSIMLAKFKLGLPDDSLLILPRNRPRVYLAGYIDKKKKALALTGSKTFKVNKPVIAGSNGSLTIGAWVNKQADQSVGTVFDNRGTVQNSDYAGTGLAVCVSFLVLGSSSSGINLTTNLEYKFAQSGYNGLIAQLLSPNSYLGITVNTPAKSLSVFMDDGSYVSGNASQFYESKYYWQAIEVKSNFSEGQTITIDDTSYSFSKNVSSSPNVVQIGSSLAATCSNLKSKLKSISTAGWGETGKGLTQSGKLLLVFFKKDMPIATISSTNKSVSNYNGNFINGPSISVGSSIVNSGLPGFAGYIYDIRIYEGAEAAKTDAFHRYLFNRLARQFNYTIKQHAEENQDNYFLDIRYDNLGLLTNIMKDTSHQEYSYNNHQLTLYSNSSAGVETDGDNYTLSIPFKVLGNLNASPVICTFLDANHSYSIAMDASGTLYCNGSKISSVNSNNPVLTLHYSSNSMLVNNDKSFPLSQRPIIVLGVYDFFTPLNGKYSITYDLDGLVLKTN
jgi:hypothetical protein